MGEYGTATNCFRVLFVIMNLIFVTLGSGLIGFGGYLIHLGTSNDYDVITGSEFISGAALILTAGVVTFIVAAIGIIGAFGMWRLILAIYTLLVVVLVVLEIAVGILGFVYHDEISNEFEDRFNETFAEYTSGQEDPNYQEEVNDVISYVQGEFMCCGVNSHEDWLEIHPDIFSAESQPPEDCLCEVGEDPHCERFTVLFDNGFVTRNITYEAWNRGCLSVLEDNLGTIAIVLGVLGLSIGFIEIFGMLVAISLIVCIFKANDDKVV